MTPTRVSDKPIINVSITILYIYLTLGCTGHSNNKPETRTVFDQVQLDFSQPAQHVYSYEASTTAVGRGGFGAESYGTLTVDILDIGLANVMFRYDSIVVSNALVSLAAYDSTFILIGMDESGSFSEGALPELYMNITFPTPDLDGDDATKVIFQLPTDTTINASDLLFGTLDLHPGSYEYDSVKHIASFEGSIQVSEVVEAKIPYEYEMIGQVAYQFNVQEKRYEESSVLFTTYIKPEGMATVGYASQIHLQYLKSK
ncbi:MAG: hypothetical protein AAFX87_01700 [Bacteroidota bacterium]